MKLLLMFMPLLWIIRPVETIPAGAQKLMKAYPGLVVGYTGNRLVFKDGSTLLYDDGKRKTATELIESPDIEDQFHYSYPTGTLTGPPQNDAGRIRNEAFFKKIYGSSATEVRKNLVPVLWCPKLIGQTILVTKVNGVHEKITQISMELDELPEFKAYVQHIGGTFLWRTIKGTTRLSMHSFGMTMDINTSFSNYWQWDCSCTDEQKTLGYKNRIPQKIVDIFEKHGFIWGGKWQHYDTMHFEYRPELVAL